MFGCRYLRFSRSTSDNELIARRKIALLEGKKDVDRKTLDSYINPDSDPYHAMLEEIRKEMHFTTLHYHRLDDMIDALDIDPECLCTYCWNGRE